MKKLIFPLLMAAVVFVTACTAPMTKEPEPVQTIVASAPSVSPDISEDWVLIPLVANKLSEPEALDPMPPVEDEAEKVEPDIYNEKIPLTREEQKMLMDACEEYGVPYALALGLIDKETNFRNIVGDDGASTGYMQIQKKWHWDRMARLGVTDLLDPEGNFMVGCDFLAELYARYDDWGMALTVYNMGHSPGYVTNYAHAVLEKYSYWQELTDIYD